jgi:hypothetical protein
MDKSPRHFSRGAPLSVLFQGYRRRINRLALKKAMERISTPVKPKSDARPQSQQT